MEEEEVMNVEEDNLDMVLKIEIIVFPAYLKEVVRGETTEMVGILDIEPITKDA